MALAWILRHPQITSVIIGASRVGHVKDAVQALEKPDFTKSELAAIEKILNK
jgi:L-glyceraldehyde 3-phosphate reductase